MSYQLKYPCTICGHSKYYHYLIGHTKDWTNFIEQCASCDSEKFFNSKYNIKPRHNYRDNLKMLERLAVAKGI